MGLKQGGDSQKRPGTKPGPVSSSSKSVGLTSKSGAKPGSASAKPGAIDGRQIGERMPAGLEDRSRKPGRGIPSRYQTSFERTDLDLDVLSSRLYCSASLT